MNKIKIIEKLVIAIFVLIGLYFTGTEIFNVFKQGFINYGIEQGIEIGIEQGKEKGRTEATNLINQNILNNVINKGKMTATIPYTDKDGNEHELKVIIINAQRINEPTTEPTE